MRFDKLVMPDKNEMTKAQFKQLEKLAKSVKIYNDIPKTTDEIIKRIASADAILTSWIDIDKGIIDSCPNLKYIGVMATGYGWIDVAAAKDKGVTVTNVPHYATESVAELIMGNLIAMSRNLAEAQKNARRTKGVYGNELKGKTIGIIGLGEIGRRLAELSSAFGMSVIYTSRTKKRVPYKYCRLKQLLKTSDVVSINYSLNPQTEKSIGGEEFRLLKNGAIFINFVHRRAVDEKALYRYVKAGRIRAILDDVQDEKLWRSPQLNRRAIVTPHIGFYTKEAIMRLSDISIQNMQHFLNGKPHNVVR